MPNIAVIFSGCGFSDGSEIRESVLTLLYLDKFGANVQIFAPNIKQKDVINHFTSEETSEKRNVLVEAARIARGEISPLAELNPIDFDGIILPGGYGVAKNLSDFAYHDKNAKILPELEEILQEIIKQKKPIGAICIAPAIIALLINGVKLTVGNNIKSADLINSLGGRHASCEANNIVIDRLNKIVSTPAYMIDAPISHIAEGIEKLVNEIVKMVDKK